MNPKDENQKPTSPVSPSVGIGNKEVERIAEVEELLRSSETSPELTPELKEVGIEAHHEAPQLTQQDRNAGLQVSGEVQSPPLQPTGSVQLPQTTNRNLGKDVKGPKELSRTWRALKSLFAGIKKPLKDALASF